MKNLNLNKEYLEELDNAKLNQEESKNLTGYATIDRPWSKFYSEKALYGELPNMKVVDYLRTNSKKHLQTNAISYFGNKIKYNKLLQSIKQVAGAYSNLGIKEDDVVSFCVPTLPETVYSFYGLNDLGVASCFIDPRSGAERIKRCLNATKSKVLVTIDLAIPKIDRIIDGTNIDTIISLPATNSLPAGLNYLYRGKEAIKNLTKKTIYNNDYIKWHRFLNGPTKEYVASTYKKDSAAAIVFTSGTTSEPKGVVISGDALNSIAFQYEHSGVPHQAGDGFLNVMPAFLLYGLACGIHMPLCLGMTDIIIPQIDFNKFADIVLKYEPKHFMVTPTLFDKLVESPKTQDKDFSYLVTPGIGGAGIPLEFEIRNNEFLRNHGCDHKLGKGWGLTEGGSAVVGTLSNECNELGGTGIPLCKNTVAAFEFSLDDNGNVIQTDKELKYNEEGEICVCGPSIMLGYLNNPELTAKTLKVHSDGKTWLHTGDAGYVNENGNVFIKDRIGRMIIRPDGHNVYLSSIEEVIATHYAVKDCAVVGVKADGFNQGKLPKAVIVLKEEYKTASKLIIDQLVDLCNEQLPERDVAYSYEIRSELPIDQSSTKIDYKNLEEFVVGEYFDANIKISNLVGNQKVLNK